ncbi:MAG: NADH-quinone oxidoreductase subunit C [Candidatus Latescibacterota bacterium]
MNWTETNNLQAVDLADIPQLPIDSFRSQILESLAAKRRCVQFFGDEEGDKVIVYAVLADHHLSRLYVAATVFDNEKKYPSLTPQAPSMHLFERELFEQVEIEPLGHPWLKPVRKGIAGIRATETPYPFFQMDGEETHEVGVGPIHAGVIEPGHFRFSCHGEEVYHLEIELGFGHRGVEDLFIRHRERPSCLLHLAESIAGDTVIGHGGAFVRAMESLSGISVSRRAMIVRTVALELERVGVHLGDLSALAGDVAYLTGNAIFGALRTRAINTSMAVCGSRFGRGLLAIGGIRFDISNELRKTIETTLSEVEDQVELAGAVMFSSASTMERFEKTGVVSESTAIEIGMVGPAARASGRAMDVRADFPFGPYNQFPVHPITYHTGDVFARAYIRYVEIKQSLRIIREQLANLSGQTLKSQKAALQPNRLVVSLAEGWRGEIAHVAITNADGKLRRYKIKDPSFHNWLALALAVRNEGISDFPLCNKSFNLSYCGFDL